MFLSKLFHREKKEGSYEDTLYEKETYASLETEEKPKQQTNIVRKLQLPDKAQEKDYVVDLCEQMTSASKDLEDAKAEYQLVTNYLTDIQIIEDLTEAEKKPIAECAKQIADLDKQRTDYLNTERQLTDTQFAQMQAEEAALPGIIRRLKANEDYLDAIKKDMAFLEGKKLEWSMQKNDAQKMQRVMRQAVIVMIVLFVTVMALLWVLAWYNGADFSLGIMLAAFVTVAAATYILVRYQDASRQIRQSDVNRNHAITLENSSKIKYVNSRNAVDFTCEKYHVRNAAELQLLYEQYQEEARQQEDFRKASDDLAYYSEELVQYLTRLRMYDARAWLNHANAIVDSRELVELKHNMIARRQKIRARIEDGTKSLSDMKKEAMKHMSGMGQDRYQVEQVIRQIEAMNPTL